MRGGMILKGKKRAVVIAGALMTTSFLVVPATPAAAQANETRAFDIPAQPLQDAIILFNRQSGIQVTAEGGLTSGRTSAAVHGEQTPAQALGALLSGTGLTYRWIDSRTVALERAPQGADGTVQLGTLRVEGVNGGGSGGLLGDGVPAAERPYRTPGSSAYISRDDIERFRGTSSADIFQGTPGVISGEARNSGGIDINIRGLQGYNRTTITIDGAQQTSSIDRGYFGDANRTFIDPDLLSSVSITKGPSNSPSSSGAIAGQVAMTTLTANDIVREGREFGIRMRVGANGNSTSPPPTGTKGGIGNHGGSYVVGGNHPILPPVEVPTDFGDSLTEGRPNWSKPTGWNGSLAVGARNANLELVAAIAHRNNGNYFAGTKGNYARTGLNFVSTSSFAATAGNIAAWTIRNPGHGFQVGDIVTTVRESYGNVGSSYYRAGEEVLNTSNKMTSGLLKGVVRLDGGHSLELGYNRSVSKFGYQFPSSIKFATDSLIDQLDRAEAETQMGTVKYRFNPSDNDLIDLNFNGWLTSQDIEETMRSRGSSEVRYIENGSRVAGMDISNRSLFDVAGGELSLRYGVAYLRQRMRQHSDSQWISSFSGTITLQNINEGSSRRRQFDAFVDGSWQPTEWLTLDAGLRFISAKTEGGGGRLLYSTSSPYPADIDSKRYSADGFAPSVGVTFEPLDGLQLYASYREGWRAPSFTESTDLIVNGTPYSYEGPVNSKALKNEISRNLEFGANFLRQGVVTADDTLGLKVNYFSNNTKNYMMMVLVNFPYDLGDGTFITASGASTINYDRALFSGFEGLLSYDAGIVFIQAAATYYDRVRFCLTETTCRDWDLAEQITTNAWRNHIPPEYSLSATAGVRLFDRRLTLAGRVGHTAGAKSKALFTYQSTTNYIANLSWDAYTLVDLSAAFQATETLKLELAAENLLDKYHVDPLAMAMQPAPGRTVRLNATFNF